MYYIPVTEFHSSRTAIGPFKSISSSVISSKSSGVQQFWQDCKSMVIFLDVRIGAGYVKVQGGFYK
jgi:hypothetical protein